MRQAVGAYAAKATEMANPTKLQAMFDKFATQAAEDPAVQSLHRRMQAGEKEASYELQQRVADQAWGGRTYMGFCFILCGKRGGMIPFHPLALLPPPHVPKTYSD